MYRRRRNDGGAGEFEGTGNEKGDSGWKLLLVGRANSGPEALPWSRSAVIKIERSGDFL
ncbi:hypothetical protein SBV1_1660012 [Verrucomicrobia bacterium]|nr:hypothetical protein SBV1_1660012 [Verrucomicrobiota bacterium]